MSKLEDGTGEMPSLSKLGDFEGESKWSGCAVLPDGRVVFVPFHASAILLFDPAAKTWHMFPQVTIRGEQSTYKVAGVKGNKCAPIVPCSW